MQQTAVRLRAGGTHAVRVALLRHRAARDGLGDDERHRACLDVADSPPALTPHRAERPTTVPLELVARACIDLLASYASPLRMAQTANCARWAGVHVSMQSGDGTVLAIACTFWAPRRRECFNKQLVVMMQRRPGFRRRSRPTAGLHWRTSPPLRTVLQISIDSWCRARWTTRSLPSTQRGTC